MQPDIEHDLQVASTPHKAKNEGLSLTEEHSVQMMQLTAESSERISQASPTGERQRVWRLRPSPTMWRLSLMIGDSFLLLTSLILLLLLASHFQLGLRVSWNEPGTWNSKLVWGSVAFVAWSIAVHMTQAQDLDCISSRFKSPLKALAALLLMLIFWLVLTSPFIAEKIISVSAALLLFLLIAALILTIWRITFAELMNLPRFRRQGVIIGVNTAAESITRELKIAKRPIVNILGYISEREDTSFQNDDLPVLGDRSTLHTLIHAGVIDLIIMAIDYNANSALFQEAIEAVQLGVTVVPMTMAYERACGKIAVEHIGDQWYVALPSEYTVSPLYLCWRKVMDITFGLGGMLVFLFILPIIALFISLDSRGPIFYRQERLGCRGQKFFIYKFRSMHMNAEPPGSAMWTTENDARVTRVGRFMRATHLDELPQVFNILRGDMSLIGPRPEREAFITQLEQVIPFYRWRLMVKPGLTGWAQAKYHYANTDNDTLIKLQYDLFYIKHQSFMLDIFIILKTVAEVFLHRGT